MPTVYSVLALGVLAISSAAVLIRLAGASGLATAFWRVTFSAVLMGLVVGGRRRVVGEVAWLPCIVGGSALGLHFWAWMVSLEHTSIASSTLFVTTTPFWVALAAPLLRNEPPVRPAGWAGMGVAAGGGAIIALSAGGVGHVTLIGIGLATVGAWLMATYLVCGRAARRTMETPVFAACTNLTASLMLGAVALATGERLGGHAEATWVAFVALAAVPQLVGHNSLLWALRYLGASVVSLTVLLEPVGASLLGWAVFSERPSGAEAAGGALLLGGLALVVRAQDRERGRFT